MYLAVIAASVSLVSFLIYLRLGLVLVYGDAVAHITIARRVFDSLTPGLDQLGTVWLPLPHLLMMPFLISKWAWRTGVGGSIPSMVAYVAGALGIFRLVRNGLRTLPGSAGITRIAAWIAVLVYGGNPNLIYLQSTAMTEPLYLALFIWATVFLSEFVQRMRETKSPGIPDNAARSLRWCALMLLGAMLTRYDGWFAGAVYGCVVLMVAALHFRRAGARWKPFWRSAERKVLLRFILVVAAAPLLWLTWNAALYGNPLEWANGQYSAKAIAERSSLAGQPHHPGWHSVKTATSYFLKSAKLNLAGGDLEREYHPKSWRNLENLWIWMAMAGIVGILVFARKLWPWLLLLLPLPFYVLSIAYGGLPVFIPAWWPFSHYNVRYSIELLPAAAVLLAALVYVIARNLHKTLWMSAVIVAALGLVGFSYYGTWKTGPICLHEAVINSSDRIVFELKLGKVLQQLPQSSIFMMNISGSSGTLERAGIPLSRTVNENHPKWKKVLTDPGKWADYIVAVGDDSAWEAARAHPQEFVQLGRVEFEGRVATIYAKEKFSRYTK